MPPRFLTTSAPVPETRSSIPLRSFSVRTGLLVMKSAGGQVNSVRIFTFSNSFGLYFSIRSVEDEARHAGVRKAERQIHRLRDGEAARLVAHREVPDVGRPGDDAVEDVLGRQQRPAGEGVDLHLAVRPLLDLLDPPLHLDAGEGRGRREVRVGERDGRGLCGRRRQRGRNGQTQDRQDCLEQRSIFIFASLLLTLVLILWLV